VRAHADAYRARGSGARLTTSRRKKAAVITRGAHRGAVARILAAVAALVAAGCGPAADRQLQGYIEGEYVRVAAPFAGALTQLNVKRGDQVTAGAPLFALERENEVAARRQSEQQLEAAQARLENLRTGKRPPEVETVEEQLRQAMATRDLSTVNLDRQQKLYAQGFVSGAVIDDARMQVKRNQAAVAELQALVATSKLPARADEIRAAEADARAAREALAQADWRLGQRAIASPVSGRVNDTYYVAGDWVPAGNPVANLLPPGNVKIRFFAPEPLLGRLRPGQSVSFSCDGCGGPMPATISFISDRAEFTPPVLYSKENRAKLVFLVEAKPAADVAARLNPGQPVDVTLPQ
jgi:HlyD family secretion protein